MDDFQKQVNEWMKDKDYYCPNIKWDKSINSVDDTSCFIHARLTVNIHGLEHSEFSFKCETENKEDSIYCAVDAISEKIFNKLTDIDIQ